MMLGLKIVFFLFGLTLVSSHVLRWGRHEPESHADEIAEVTPFITHFLPPGSNFFYKPNFYISSPIAKIIEKDCKQIEMSQEFRPPMPTFVFAPPKEEIVEYSVPAIPEILNLAELPRPELPMAIDCDPIPESKPVPIPQAPILAPLQMPALPELIVPQYVPIAVPEAPILPPFTMPDIPEIPSAPSLPPLSMPKPPSSEPISIEPAFIPEAPVLPPFSMPELPEIVEEKIPAPFVPCDHELTEFKPVEIPSAPVLPTISMPALSEPLPIEPFVPDFDPTPKDPVIIPEAPILPPFSMPEISFIEAIPEQPCDNRLEIQAVPEGQVLKPAPSIPYSEPMSIETVNIPEAPVLPAFTMPELPEPIIGEAKPEKECDHIMELPVMPEALILPSLPILPPAPSMPEFDQISIEPVNIPEAPVLPPLSMPELSTPILETIPEKNCDHTLEPLSLPELPKIEEFKPISVPQAPILPPFTMPELPTLPIAEFKPEISEVPALPPFIEELQQYQPYQPPAVLPEAPEVPHTPLLEGMASQFAMSFPNYCAQTIVLERVLPKMAIHEVDFKRPIFKYPIPYKPSIY